MIKKVELIVTEEQTVEVEPGVEFTETVERFRVVSVTPKAGDDYPGKFIRNHDNETLKTYLWNAPVDDWNDNVDCNPDNESRWELEVYNG